MTSTLLFHQTALGCVHNTPDITSKRNSSESFSLFTKLLRHTCAEEQRVKGAGFTADVSMLITYAYCDWLIASVRDSLNIVDRDIMLPHSNEYYKMQVFS